MRIFFIGLYLLIGSQWFGTAVSAQKQGAEPDYAFFENLKAPFKPHLIFFAEGSENLCKAFEYQMNIEYFRGFVDPLPADGFEFTRGNLLPEWVHRNYGVPEQHHINWNASAYDYVFNSKSHSFELYTDLSGSQMALECAVSLEPSFDFVSRLKTTLPSLKNLLESSTAIIGNQPKCEPEFKGYDIDRRSDTRFNAIRMVYQPWWLAQNFRNRDYSEFQQRTLNGYSYSWSLLSPSNRKKLADFEVSQSRLVSELANYYQRVYYIEQDLALGLARAYVATIDSYSTRPSYFYGSYDPLDPARMLPKKVQDNTANAVDFLALAELLETPSRFWSGQSKRPDRNAVALILAIGAQASKPILEKLISKGANIDYNLNDTPLMNAADHLPTLNFLLEKGAKPNVQNGFGKTALMMAAHMNEKEAVGVLLESGADPNVTTFSELDDCRYGQLKYRNRTALMYAAENASPEIFDMLVAAGADVNAADSQGRTIDDYKKLNPMYH